MDEAGICCCTSIHPNVSEHPFETILPVEQLVQTVDDGHKTHPCIVFPQRVHVLGELR